MADVIFSNSTSNPTSSSRKRKGVQQSSKQNEKKKKRSAGRGSQLFSRLDKLVDSVSTKSECTSSVLHKKKVVA